MNSRETKSRFGNSLSLGAASKIGTQTILRPEHRASHAYIVGATGTGKSKFIEGLIRQEIKAWPKSHCGLLFLDPHGGTFDSLMNWAAWHNATRPIIPIDLRRDDWIIAYNLLHPRSNADQAVIVNNFVQAVAYAWGEAGTDKTPRFARWATNIFSTLYEQQKTLLEAEQLMSRVDKRARQLAAASLKNTAAAEDWHFANTLPPFQFESEIGSTISRLYRFLGTQTMRRMFGQKEISLNLEEAIENGYIILVCLATERNKISDEDASLFATLLLSDLWTAAKSRGKSEKPHKPFYVYIDEFQNYVTPTIAQNLDQARGFGLHLTLAHQFPQQLAHAGAHGRQVLDSVLVNARSKIVFSLSGEENLRPIALDLFGDISPDRIRDELFSTKVMGYREETRKIHSHGQSEAAGQTYQSGSAWGEGMGGSAIYPGTNFVGFTSMIRPTSLSKSDSRFGSHSQSRSDSWSRSHSESESEVPLLIPVMGQELVSRHYEPINDQIFKAMQAIQSQGHRECMIKIVGSRSPVSITTPFVETPPASKRRIEAYTQALLERCPFALPAAEADRRIQSRRELPPNIISAEALQEPSGAKRKIAAKPKQQGENAA